MNQFFAEVKSVEEKSQEERIWQLECQVSMLQDLVGQLVGELNAKGIAVSDKIDYSYEGESE